MESVKHENGSGSSEEEDEDDKYEPDLDLEKDLPLGTVPPNKHDCIIFLMFGGSTFPFLPIVMSTLKYFLLLISLNMFSLFPNRKIVCSKDMLLWSVPATEPVLVERLDTDMLFSLPPVLAEEKEKTPRPRTRRRVMNASSSITSHPVLSCD